MNSIVCLKQVPDTEAQIIATSDGSDVKLDGVKFIISPYDDYGIEERIRIRHCFFSADKSKMVNCVSASASAKHIEAPINTNNNLPDC